MNFKNFIFLMPKKFRFAAFKCKQIKTTFVIGPLLYAHFFFHTASEKKKYEKKNIAN